MTLEPNQPRRGTPKSLSKNPMSIKGDRNFDSSNPISKARGNHVGSDQTPHEKSVNRLKRAGAEVTAHVPRGYVKNQSSAKTPLRNVSARKNRKLKG